MIFVFALICSFAVIGLVDGVSRGYNESEALTAVYYAFGAYCDAECLMAWDCKEWSEKRPHFAVDSVVIAKKRKLQAFTGYDAERKQIVISFRGTQSNNNLLLDFDWEQMYFKEGKTYNSGGGVWGIHEGFYWGLHELFDEGLFVSLESLFTKHNGATVLITGHSLGGALAQMLALMFVTTPLFHPISIGDVTIITFGSPRWGSKDIVTYFNTLPHTNWRVVNKYDMIPTMPWVTMGDFGYYHPKSEVLYPEWGTLTHTLCGGDGDPETRPTPNCPHVVPSKDIKYHDVYLNVYENGCGKHQPKEEWHFHPSTTLAVVDTTHVSTTDHVSKARNTTKPSNIDEKTKQLTAEPMQTKQHIDWMRIGVVCAGAVGGLSVVLCCLLLVKRYQKSKNENATDQNDDYMQIHDI